MTPEVKVSLPKRVTGAGDWSPRALWSVNKHMVKGVPGYLDGLEGSAPEPKSFTDRPDSLSATQLERNVQHAQQWIKQIENENKG